MVIAAILMMLLVGTCFCSYKAGYWRGRADYDPFYRRKEPDFNKMRSQYDKAMERLMRKEVGDE